MNNLLFLTSRFPPYPGGAETYAYDLTKHLQKLSWQSTIITDTRSKFLDKGLLIEKSTSIIEPVLPLNELKDTSKVSWRVMQFGLLDNIGKVFTKLPTIDIVHSNSIESSIMGRMIADHLGVPLVATIHEHAPEKQAFGKGRCELVFRRLGIDALIAPSDFYFERALRYGFPKQKLHLITHGVSQDRILSHPIKNLRTVWNKNSEELIYAVFVGRIYEPKGVIIFVEAAEKLRRNKNFKAIIAGPDGPDDYARNLRQKIKEYRLEKVVKLVGEVSPTMIPSVLSSADIIVAPSLAEGFGLGVVEAMILGKPVVVSNVGGLKQIVQNEYSGMLVDPGNAEQLAHTIQKLIDSAELRKQLSKTGQKIALEKFSADTMAMNTSKLYNSLIL